MSRHKRLREALSIIEEAGLHIVTVIPGAHYKVVTERCGCRKMIIVSTSQSDSRAIKNFRALTRRLAAEIDNSTQA